MGILNITPDSFSDGNLFFDRNKAVHHGLRLISEGAEIIDVGGESSRPGSEPIPVQEELNRVLPVISELREQSDVLLSVDTTKAEVAEKAIDAGADIVNDISSFRFDPEMLPLIAERETPIILMHMKGTPKTMQENPTYHNLLEEVKSFFEQRLEAAVESGVKREKIILDPGIGFGKSHEDNLSLILNLGFLEDLERPILIGPSRKSFIGRILNLPPQKRLEGSLSAAVLSIAFGAHILRVHDVAATKRAVRVAEAILNGRRQPGQPANPREKKQSCVC
jgi:dihydropteroate synthase